MAFVSIPNGVRIAHLGTMNGVQIVNTFGCQNGVGSIGDDLGVLAKSHGDAWRAQIVPLLNSAYHHENTLAYSLEDQSAAAGDASYGSALAGGGTSVNPLPMNCALVISLKTGKRGRTYQGRAYIPALSVNAIGTDGHSWSAATVSAWQTAFAAYKDAVDPATGDNGRLAVCSAGSPLKGISPHVEAVTSFIVRAQIGTQRRRLS